MDFENSGVIDFLTQSGVAKGLVQRDVMESNLVEVVVVYNE